MQSIFLYDNGLRHERVNNCITIQCHYPKFSGFDLFQCRSSPPKVFLLKGVLKVCSKFIGEHPCRSVISIRLQSNFIEITLLHGCSAVNLLHIFSTPFPKNFSGWLLKPLVTLKSRQGVSIEKISSVIQKFINKHQGYFETVCKSKQEQLHLVS